MAFMLVVQLYITAFLSLILSAGNRTRAYKQKYTEKPKLPSKPFTSLAYLINPLQWIQHTFKVVLGRKCNQAVCSGVVVFLASWVHVTSVGGLVQPLLHLRCIHAAQQRAFVLGVGANAEYTLVVGPAAWSSTGMSTTRGT